MNTEINYFHRDEYNFKDFFSRNCRRELTSAKKKRSQILCPMENSFRLM